MQIRNILIASLMLLIQTLLSEKEIEYLHMLGSCNHLTGRNLEIRKFEMKEKEREIQSLRNQVALKINGVYELPTPTSHGI